jgi:hypothetical protein
MSLTVNVGAALSKGLVSYTFAQTKTATVSGNGYSIQSPVLGTATSQISTATMQTLGYAFLQSLVTTTQSTCTITFGRLSGTTMHSVVRLRPGDPAILRLAPGDYAASAAQEGYRLLVGIIED